MVDSGINMLSFFHRLKNLGVFTRSVVALDRLASTYCRCTPPLVDFSRASPQSLFEQPANRVFQHPASTTVSLTLFPYVAARTSIQFSYDVASDHEAQGGDGIGHVTLRALDCRAGCNFGVGKVFLIE